MSCLHIPMTMYDHVIPIYSFSPEAGTTKSCSRSGPQRKACRVGLAWESTLLVSELLTAALWRPETGLLCCSSTASTDGFVKFRTTSGRQVGSGSLKNQCCPCVPLVTPGFHTFPYISILQMLLWMLEGTQPCIVDLEVFGKAGNEIPFNEPPLIYQWNSATNLIHSIPFLSCIWRSPRHIPIMQKQTFWNRKASNCGT